MPAPNLTEAVDDSELGESFTILRSNGQFVAGGFQSTVTQLQAFGVVSVASPKDLEMMPEGDRFADIRSFYVSQPLYTTRDNSAEGTGVSDILLWQGFQYRILRVSPYGNRGYWKGWATRILGV
jgi:hypothetical protein